MSLRYDAPAYCDINHHICEGKRDWGIFLFAFSDNLISEVWFFAEGEWFLFQSPQYSSTEPFYFIGIAPHKKFESRGLK